MGTTHLRADRNARITAPIYGFYAGNDNRVNATLDKTKELTKKAGKTFEPVIYDGAGHGFMRGGDDTKGRDGDKKAREEAWKRWMELLKKI